MRSPPRCSGSTASCESALWIWLGVTIIGTVYLGWHYVIDDVAGIAMGAIALFVASALTGFDLRAERRSKLQSEAA